MFSCNCNFHMSTCKSFLTLRKQCAMNESNLRLPSHTRICKACGTLNTEGEGLPGSGWIELVLYVCYIVPGIIYSIWRRTKKNAACVACSSRDLVQIGTPIGKSLFKQHHPDATVAAGSLHAPPAKPTQHSVSRIFKMLGVFVILAWVWIYFIGH